MIDGNKITGFYADYFGNEIDIYEQVSKYTVSYKGFLFEGDGDGWNFHDYDRWEDAYELYNFYGDMIEIKDNEYDVTFSHGDWN